MQTGPALPNAESNARPRRGAPLSMVLWCHRAHSTVLRLLWWRCLWPIQNMNIKKDGKWLELTCMYMRYMTTQYFYIWRSVIIAHVHGRRKHFFQRGI